MCTGVCVYVILLLIYQFRVSTCAWGPPAPGVNWCLSVKTALSLDAVPWYHHLWGCCCVYWANSNFSRCISDRGGVQVRAFVKAAGHPVAKDRASMVEAAATVVIVSGPRQGPGSRDRANESRALEPRTKCYVRYKCHITMDERQRQRHSQVASLRQQRNSQFEKKRQIDTSVVHGTAIETQYGRLAFSGPRLQDKEKALCSQAAITASQQQPEGKRVNSIHVAVLKCNWNTAVTGNAAVRLLVLAARQRSYGRDSFMWAQVVRVIQADFVSNRDSCALKCRLLPRIFGLGQWQALTICRKLFHTTKPRYILVKKRNG